MQFPPRGQIGIEKRLLILGCMGLGAGLMYLLDPSIGKRRRAVVRDKAQSYWKRQEDFIGKTAREVRNRARGLVAEARTHLSSAEVPDDASLVARVRAQIGHIISNAGAIGVTARQGCVTLSGPIPSDEAPKLLSTVEGVSGVKEVVNQLEGHAERGHISGLQGHNTAV
jgi:osmotically-inducible protein OsmY